MEDSNYDGIFVVEKLLVILMVFVMQAVFAGVLFSFSEYFSLLVDKFNVSYAYIGFIGTSVAGFSNFVGPFSGWLIVKFPYGVVIPFAGMILALSFYLTSLDNNYWELLFTYSFLFGISGGILSHLSLSCLLDLMSSKEEVATALSISNIGTGVGIICVSIYAAYFTNVNHILTLDQLLRYMSFLGLLVTVVGIFVFSFVSDKRKKHLTNIEIVQQGSSFKLDEETPLFEDQSLSNKSSSFKTSNPNKKYGWELLFSYDGINDKATQLFISQLIGFPMTMIPFKFAIIYGTSEISDINMYYYVPIAMGCGTVFARFTFGKIASSKNISSFMINKFLQIGTLISSINLAYANLASEPQVLFGLFFYSLFNSHFPLVALRTVELLGNYQHHVNFGVQSFAVGIGYVIGGYTGGSIYDINKDMKVLFLSCAIGFIIAFIYDEIIFYEKSITKWIIDINLPNKQEELSALL